MRESTKQVLFLLALVMTLAAILAFALWRMAKARERAGRAPTVGSSSQVCRRTISRASGD